MEAEFDRGDLSDEEWAVVGLLLPSERGRKARPANDNRRFLNGMLHVLRVGCSLARHARALRQVKLGLFPLPPLG
ncbi:transposase [Novosphingobium sp. 9U]|uniref:transposase n=1 Tax=Novosphingobium sp. 9U TaxID=2653158 RepID=UPI0012F3F0A5|nr:transposase [Novosphingobium sp. 9U]VWX54966.1 hypothetical protein NOVOSPHI9U_740003 [Novosphingobium sp. 9U]